MTYIPINCWIPSYYSYVSFSRLYVLMFSRSMSILASFMQIRRDLSVSVQSWSKSKSSSVSSLFLSSILSCDSVSSESADVSSFMTLLGLVLVLVLLLEFDVRSLLNVMMFLSKHLTYPILMIIVQNNEKKFFLIIFFNSASWTLPSSVPRICVDDTAFNSDSVLFDWLLMMLVR